MVGDRTQAGVKVRSKGGSNEINRGYIDVAKGAPRFPVLLDLRWPDSRESIRRFARIA